MSFLNVRTMGLACMASLALWATAISSVNAQTDYARALCAERWADDFAARERCIVRQYEAMEDYLAWSHEVVPRMDAAIAGDIRALDDPIIQINRLCTDRWLRDGPADKDFAAMMRCVERQRAAQQRLAQ